MLRRDTQVLETKSVWSKDLVLPINLYDLAI